MNPVISLTILPNLDSQGYMCMMVTTTVHIQSLCRDSRSLVELLKKVHIKRGWSDDIMRYFVKSAAAILFLTVAAAYINNYNRQQFGISYRVLLTTNTWTDSIPIQTQYGSMGHLKWVKQTVVAFRVTGTTLKIIGNVLIQFRQFSMKEC